MPRRITSSCSGQMCRSSSFSLRYGIAACRRVDVGRAVVEPIRRGCPTVTQTGEAYRCHISTGRSSPSPVCATGSTLAPGLRIVTVIGHALPRHRRVLADLLRAAARALSSAASRSRVFPDHRLAVVDPSRLDADPDQLAAEVRSGR